MCSQIHEKNALKMALEDPQKYVAKQRKTKLSALFGFRGVKNTSYLFYATFQQSLLLKL